MARTIKGDSPIFLHTSTDTVWSGLYQMAPTFTYDEINSDQSQVTNDGLRNVGNVAADLVCDLWENYSEWTSGFSDPTGIGRINNALFTRLCKPRGKEPSQPQLVPFTGGQCTKLYNCSYKITREPTGLVNQGTAFNVPGPIKGIQTAAGGSANNIKIVVQGTPTLQNPLGSVTIVEGPKSDLIPFTINSFSAVPVSGPDNCGDPPAQYPPKLPPPSAVRKPVNVNIGAGVVIPVVATFAPILFRPNVEINPQVQVDVGPFNVTFDAGGVTIAPNFNFTGGDKVLPPASSYPTTSIDIKNQNNTTEACDLTPVNMRLDFIEDKIDAIDDTLDDIKECACPVGYEVTTVAGGSGNSGVLSLPLRTIQVRLNLTDIPDNPKVIQSSGAEAPLQYFCGYYSFGDGSGLGSRQAINTAQSVFEVPTWATSFSWSLYTGYSASVSFVTLTPEKAGAELAARQLKMPPA